VRLGREPVTGADDLIRLQGTPGWARTANLNPRTNYSEFPTVGAPWKIYWPLPGPPHEFDDVIEHIEVELRHRQGILGQHRDLCRYVRGWMPWGNKNPLQKLKIFFAMKQIRSLKEKITFPVEMGW
jgi:hypothetical protein